MIRKKNRGIVQGWIRHKLRFTDKGPWLRTKRRTPRGTDPRLFRGRDRGSHQLQKSIAKRGKKDSWKNDVDRHMRRYCKGLKEMLCNRKSISSTRFSGVEKNASGNVSGMLACPDPHMEKRKADAASRTAQCGRLVERGVKER